MIHILPKLDTITSIETYCTYRGQWRRYYAELSTTLCELKRQNRLAQREGRFTRQRHLDTHLLKTVAAVANSERRQSKLRAQELWLNSWLNSHPELAMK